MAFLVARIGAKNDPSVSETTLACIRFQVTKNQHLDQNIRIFGSCYRIFQTAIRFHYPNLVYEGQYNRPEPFLMQPEP